MKKAGFKGVLKRIGVTVLILSLQFSGFPFRGMLTAVQAAETDTGGLTVNQDTAKQAGLFGFSSTEPVKKDLQGNTVDKTKNNPLGASMTCINRTLNLSVSGYQWNGSQMGLTTYDDPKTLVFGSVIPAGDSLYGSDYNNYVKAMTAADLNGDVRQEVATLELKPTSGNQCIPYIIVRSYIKDANQHSFETRYQLDITIPMPASTLNFGVEYPVNIVAGDFNHGGRDELAVLIDNTIYILKSDDNFNLTQVSKYTFSMPTYLILVQQITITSADANNDGFAELLVTAPSPVTKGGATNPLLLIYNSDSLKSVWKTVNLSFDPGNGKIYFTTPGVDVGDVFGDGNKSIVVGGMASDGKIYVATAGYDLQSDAYPGDLSDSFFEIGFKGNTAGNNPSNMWGVLNKASLNLKCVSFAGPVSGEPEWFELGGTLYRYDKSTGKFVKQEIKTKTYANTGAFAYSPGNSDGLLDIECDGDGIGNDGQAYILNTVVGNFDGNKEGKEQIIMLHYDNLHNTMGQGQERVVITYCGTDKDGNFTALNTSIRPVGAPYMHPAICAPDVYGNTTKLIYEPEKSTFVFSQPSVIAVLGASPYYQEIADRDDSYAGNLSNASTTLGTESESGTSTSNGIEAHVGVSFGFEQEQSILGVVTVSKESFEASLSYSFTSTWTSSRSITKGITYQNSLSDSVVVMVVPCDIFCYQVIGPKGDKTEMTINVPYAPQTVQMPIDHYNAVVSQNNIAGAPIISADVLHHTQGDPRTYPQSMRDIPNAKKEVLLGPDFKAVDEGTNAISTQSIAVTETEEKTFDHALDLSFEASLSIFGATMKSNVGVGYIRSETTTSSKSTEVSGSVAGLPQDFINNSYGFIWQLAFYNCDLPVIGSSMPQTCYVVSYLVKPQNSSAGYPPYIPKNLKVSSQGQDSVTLMWDKVENGAGYRVSRSDTEDGDYAKITDIAGSDNISFTDNTVHSGTTHYYKVRSYNVSDGLDCDAVSGFSLPVSSIVVASPPKLNYSPGDALDLSSLTVNLIYGDYSTKTISFANFGADNLTVSPANGTELNAANNGSSVAVIYTPPGSNQYQIVSAGTLTVRMVKSVEMSSPPKLYYTVKDPLDLSELTVELIYNDNTRKPVNYRDFGANNLSVNNSNHKQLGVSDSGTPVTVTYAGATSTGQPISFDAGTLAVYAGGENSVLLSATFAVGTQKNAKTLSPNQPLLASITVANTQNKAQDVLVLLALYNEEGTMVQMTNGTVNVDKNGPNATKMFVLRFTLPEDTNGSYKVRVFAWDGTSLSTTHQVPLSNIIQMP